MLLGIKNIIKLCMLDILKIKTHVSCLFIYLLNSKLLKVLLFKIFLESRKVGIFSYSSRTFYSIFENDYIINQIHIKKVKTSFFFYKYN